MVRVRQRRWDADTHHRSITTAIPHYSLTHGHRCRCKVGSLTVVKTANRWLTARVDESDVLQAAGQYQCLEHMDELKFAVRERTGEISIIPKRQAKG